MSTSFASRSPVGNALLYNLRGCFTSTYRVDGQVHSDGQLILDSLIDLLLDLVANVLVFVGRAEHLVNLTVVAIQLLLIG